MLTAAYNEIKRLRSRGNCEAAIAMLRAKAPASDDDAFEAVVCLLVCGDIDSAVNVCRTYAWTQEWARRMTRALADSLMGGTDSTGALQLARSAITDKNAPFDASAIYLLLLQRSGLIEEAAAYISSRLPSPPPGENLLLTLMAEVATATQDWREASGLACAVLSVDPDDYRTLVTMSVSSYGLGNFHESLGYARRADRINRGLPQSILQIMRCENKLGDYYATIAAFDKLTDKSVVAPEIHVELGAAYAALDNHARAIAEYQAALASGSRSIAALRALVLLYAVGGDTAELGALVQAYRAEIRSDGECVHRLGLERLGRGDLDGAAHEFKGSRMIYENSGHALDSMLWPVPEPRIRHDYEQLELLEQRGKLDGTGLDALKVLKPYYDQSGDVRATFAPEGAEAQALKRALGRIHHLPDPPFAGRALAHADYGALEDKYLSDRLVVIDDFLSPEALAVLRRFCEEATVWKSYYTHGYLGALLATGFSPKVLLAVSEELRRVMPRVIGGDRLLQAWGFKYDQRMQGINMHADFAKVNVNFWITPDEACEDPATGGMVVYDLPVPKSWTFVDYNTDAAKLEAFLKVHDAKSVRVPYRENRCVLFDSSLIHVSDEMHFKSGYKNRRVNVTLLYGKALSVE